MLVVRVDRMLLDAILLVRIEVTENSVHYSFPAPDEEDEEDEYYE